MITKSTALFMLLLLPLATVAQAGEPETEFVRLARTFDADAPGALSTALERLAETDPRFWEMPLPPCPLRSEWAGSLVPDDALRRLRETKAKATLVWNLASRADIAHLILESEILADLLPGHARPVARIAAAALLDGDPRLVKTLLLRSDAVLETAAVLSALPHPDGLWALADATTGALPLDEEARARLAAFEPDVQNLIPARPLGTARVKALGRVAATDPDPAARALAARILFRANDPSIAKETVEAWRAARTVRLYEWGKLGAYAETVLTDPGMSMGDRLDMLEGWLLWGWVRAEHDPLAAEATAAEFRRVLGAAPVRFRGEAARFLQAHHHIFVTTTAERKRAVPSLLAILADLDRGREGDPEHLTALGRRMAARIRRELTREESYGHIRMPRPPRPLAPPLGLAARVLAGTEENPEILALLADELEPPSAADADEKGVEWFQAEIPASLRPQLAARIRTAGDLELARWAAGLLALRGTDEDVEALFLNGGHAAVEEIHTSRRLAAALAFIEEGKAPNAEKVAVFGIVRMQEEPGPRFAEVLARWIEDRLPNLDRDLREALLEDD